MGEPPEGQLNGAVTGGGPLISIPASETVGSKRQRRPSVRLGDIGGDHQHHHHQPYDSYLRRITNTSASNAATKQFKHYHFANVDYKKESSKSSKVRALTNLKSNSGELNETLDENLDSIAIGSWKVKDSKKRGCTKRVRSNWVSKNNESGDNNNKNDDVSNHHNNKFEVGDSKYSDGEDMEDGYREFNMENSESPMKEQCPVDSFDNLGDDHEREDFYYNRRVPVRGNKDHNNGVELSGPSDNEAREWHRGEGEDGVRIWLNSLGLGRYAPVFEVHEVDDEVLPMLTLEDLKDMGINAVGSRRKMYCAIQKLGKGFS